MLISWDWDKPVTCSEHGRLSDEPLPHHDAGILAMKHLRDVHGIDTDQALAKVRAHKAKVASDGAEGDAGDSAAVHGKRD